jgi:hypothetical protein
MILKDIASIEVLIRALTGNCSLISISEMISALIGACSIAIPIQRLITVLNIGTQLLPMTGAIVL